MRPSPLNVGIVQKCISAADLHPLSLDALSPSVFRNEYSEANEDSCKRRAIKIHRQSNAYINEDSPGGDFEVPSSVRSISKNKIRRESCIEAASSSTPREKHNGNRRLSSQIDELFTPKMSLENSMTQGVTMVFNSGKKGGEEGALKGSVLKPCSIPKDRDSTSMEFEDCAAASECSDDAESWQKVTLGAALEAKGNKRTAGKRYICFYG